MPLVSVIKKHKNQIWVIKICRPHVRNCVNKDTAEQLAQAFTDFDHDPTSKVAILTGEGDNFCAGADLKAISEGKLNRIEPTGDGPMGPTRMKLRKPVISAISGYCVAGGLELALWSDLRVCDETAVFGVFCRRFGVPLIDGGSVRLPRLIGLSRAMDMILTGRAVQAKEAFEWGLVNRLVKKGELMKEAEKLALQLCQFPQECMNGDRLSAIEQFGMSLGDALYNEFRRGMVGLKKEGLSGAKRFAQGQGKHGLFNSKL